MGGDADGAWGYRTARPLVLKASAQGLHLDGERFSHAVDAPRALLRQPLHTLCMRMSLCISCTGVLCCKLQVVPSCSMVQSTQLQLYRTYKLQLVQLYKLHSCIQYTLQVKGLKSPKAPVQAPLGWRKSKFLFQTRQISLRQISIQAGKFSTNFPHLTPSKHHSLSRIRLANFAQILSHPTPTLPQGLLGQITPKT